MVLFTAAAAPTGRPDPLHQLYSTLEDLRDRTDGPYYLRDCTGRMDWPARGIYFFFTPESDLRHDPPTEWDLCRIGTVGVSAGSSNTLWDRLRQHRGNCRGDYADGGNHRGSIFRRHVGRAMITRDGRHDEFPNWGTTHSEGIDLETPVLREQEHSLEEAVSEYIRDLPFLAVDIPGEPGTASDRAYIEKNLIALVAHYRRSSPALRPSEALTKCSPYPEIWRTALWNVNHVDGLFDPSIVDDLDSYVVETAPIG